jgi:Na+/H+ antiporter NhaD/arsenite permease-like protein
MIILISSVFILGYVLISAEHKSQVSKSAIAVLLAAVMWILVSLTSHSDFTPHLSEAGGEIFEIIVFLLAAMTLVEILVHYKYFDFVRSKIIAKKLSVVQLAWVISGLTFILSSIIDNMTSTIIFTQLSRLFFKGKNLIAMAALIIISANAGGAFSPIGDVTTTMLWIQGKFTSGEIVLYGFLPSLVIYLVAASIMISRLDKGAHDMSPSEDDFELMRSEKLVIAIAFGSFSLPFIFHGIGLKPYMGLMAGLGLTWLTIDILKRSLPEHKSHFTASIENLLQKTDIASLKFFIGILLAVAALNHLGVLEIVSNRIFGDHPSLVGFVIGSSVMGALSSIVDNVPLTAAAMDILKTSDSSIWVLLALTVGTGGSMLVIGSAAGVVAMGVVKKLNFSNYLRVAALPAVLSYICGIGVWYIQHILFS